MGVGDSDGKESACSAGDLISPLGRKDPWRRGRLPTPVFLPGEFHRQKSLLGYSLRGQIELDTTKRLSMHTHTNMTQMSLNITTRTKRSQTNKNISHMIALGKILEN